MSDPSAKPRSLPTTVLARLVALRSRFVKAGLTLAAIFVCLFPFANRVFAVMSAPIFAKLPEGSELLAKSVASPFLTPLKASMWAALFIGMPFVLYHLWRFVELWLKDRGRRLALPFMIGSAALFYAGAAFAFFVVLPMVFGFFAQIAPTGVTFMPDINAYLNFVIAMLFAFGLAFQVPIAIIILVWTGLVSRKTLAAGRPYIFLGAFVFGMLLTPPDVFSQTLLAVPMYALFEAALFFCARFIPERSD